MLRTFILVSLIASVRSSPSVEEPECYMTLPEVAKYYGFPSEVHLVTTEDDYILEVHRIPYGRGKQEMSNRPVVFLQHGLFVDGAIWGANLANQSAAFVFADAGFDVWIANSRGTPPSQKHVGFGPEQKRFWNFTWQEMATHDLTSSIDYVLQVTKQENLYYVGHSQGTIVMFAKLSEDPDFASKVRHFYALAPVATVSHIGGLYRLFGYRLFYIAEFILDRIPNTPLSLPKFIRRLFGFFCSLPLAADICSLDIGFIQGPEKMLNMTRLGLYLCHTPVATSSKNLLHWVQAVKSKKFGKFDYGEKGNMREYAEKKPPLYDVQKIRVPSTVFWSRDDIFADVQDIRETLLHSMNDTIQTTYELSHYSHMDFVLAVNATDDIYRPIVAQIRKDFVMRNALRIGQKAT
ncbi:hypothetical protein Q1695_015635 [Nippostrongylus brasiliensis]|nr:hypothetical protein Q1695_015635 [Nippostrongylus brasiliensis]